MWLDFPQLQLGELSCKSMGHIGFIGRAWSFFAKLSISEYQFKKKLVIVT